MSSFLKPRIKKALLKALNEYVDAMAKFKMHRAKEEIRAKANTDQNQKNEVPSKKRLSSVADSPVVPALENFMLVDLRVQLLKFLKSDDEHTRAQVSDGVHWIKCLIDSEAVTAMEEKSSLQIKDHIRAIFQIAKCRFVHVKLSGHPFYYLIVDELALLGVENTELIGTPIHINEDRAFLAQSSAIFRNSGTVMSSDIVSGTSNSTKNKKQKQEVFEAVKPQNRDSGGNFGWNNIQLTDFNREFRQDQTLETHTRTPTDAITSIGYIPARLPEKQTTEKFNESVTSIIEKFSQFHNVILNHNFDIQKIQGIENTATASKLSLALQTPSVSQQNHQAPSIESISERAELLTAPIKSDDENDEITEIFSEIKKLSENTTSNQGNYAAFLTQADVDIEITENNAIERQKKAVDHSATYTTVESVKLLFDAAPTITKFKTQILAIDDNLPKSVELNSLSNEKFTQKSIAFIDNDLATISFNEAKEVHEENIQDFQNADSPSTPIGNNASLQILKTSLLQKVDSAAENVVDLTLDFVRIRSMSSPMEHLHEREHITEEPEKKIITKTADNTENSFESFESSNVIRETWSENFSEVNQHQTFKTSPNKKVWDDRLDAETITVESQKRGDENADQTAVDVSNALQIQRTEIVESSDTKLIESQNYVKHVAKVDSNIDSEVNLEDLKTQTQVLQPPYNEIKSILDIRKHFVSDFGKSHEAGDSYGQIFHIQIPENDESQLPDAHYHKSKTDSGNPIEDKLGAILEDARRTTQIISKTD
ncbi:hypothetical protein HK100_012721, partial [Physocladia obscura]